MIADFHFLRPWWLLALFAPPLLVWMASCATDVRSQWKGMIAPHLLDSLVVEPSRRKDLAPVRILAILTACAVVGVAGPAWRREPPPFVSDTASLVIAVDLSTTMDLADVSPSRIERAKLKIQDILASRAGARTAVIAYAGTAHLVVPLTEDTSLVQTYTDALSTRIMPKAGKDTAAALKLADTLLISDGQPGTILLMTDGVEPSAASAAREMASGVLLLGFGLPGATGRGIDLGSLKKFADATGAAVATSTDDDTDIRWIGEHVRNDFERRNAKSEDRWRDEGRWLLIPTVILSALSFRRGWVTKVATVLLAVRLLAPGSAEAAGSKDLWLTPDQQGRAAFERGDFVAAAGLFRDPMWRGTAFYRSGEFQKAVDSFALVESAEGHFDQANALMHLGKFDDASDAYAQALSLRKDWPEAQANLALARRLSKAQQDDEAEEPKEKPDSISVDGKGKKGKAGKIDLAEQTSEIWIKNIQVSPADLMARRFSLEDAEVGKR